MRLFVLLLMLSICISSCDDGDVITVELTEFGDTFKACGELVFFKTKPDPAESISLIISSGLEIDDFLETTIENNMATLVNPTLTFTINNSNTFNYRTYNVEPLNFFCNDVPPSNIEINSDQENTNNDGEAIFITTLEEDDNDGIPAEDEDLNMNGDLTDDDSDADGIPNYLDADDDGDNVLTIDEDDDTDGDGNPFTNPLNTDGMDAPDYLDTDDDNDGVLTRDEENDSADQDPTNDRTDMANPSLADYLNPAIATLINPATAYREHSIQQNFVVRLELTNIQLQTLTQDEFNFGTLENSALNNTIRTIIPDFN